MSWASGERFGLEPVTAPPGSRRSRSRRDRAGPGSTSMYSDNSYIGHSSSAPPRPSPVPPVTRRGPAWLPRGAGLPVGALHMQLQDQAFVLDHGAPVVVPVRVLALH